MAAFIAYSLIIFKSQFISCRVTAPVREITAVNTKEDTAARRKTEPSGQRKPAIMIAAATDSSVLNISDGLGR